MCEVKKEIEFLACNVSYKSCCFWIQLRPVTVAGQKTVFFFPVPATVNLLYDTLRLELRPTVALQQEASQFFTVRNTLKVGGACNTHEDNKRIHNFSRKSGVKDHLGDVQHRRGIKEIQCGRVGRIQLAQEREQ